MVEIWKDTFVHPNSYEVSNMGRVRSKERLVLGKWGNKAHRSSVLLRPGISKTGYSRVSLVEDNVRKNVSVHRLVAKAFLPIVEKFKDQVNHKDGNKLNNTVDNLEWCTISENNVHARITGLNIAKTGRNNHSYGFNNKQSLIVKNIDTGEIKPIVEACAEYPFTRRHFTMMIRGERTNKTKYILT